MIVSAGNQHTTGIAGKSKREDCSDDGNAPSIRCVCEVDLARHGG